MPPFLRSDSFSSQWWHRPLACALGTRVCKLSSIAPAHTCDRGSAAPNSCKTPEPSRRSTQSLLCTLLFLALPLAACVTEYDNKPSRNSRLGTQQASAAQKKAELAKAREAGKAAASADAASPTEAAASTDASTDSSASSRTTSRVQVAVRPMGEVTYDGLSLPIVSPDGNHLAVHQGEAPDWPALLAEPEAETPPNGRVVLFDRTDKGFTPRSLAPDAAAKLQGLLLGRDASNEGVLVETIEGAGTRRVGILSWTTGAIRWLTPQGERFGHAAMLPAKSGRAATVACIRWTSTSSELVLLSLDAASEAPSTAQPLAVAAIGTSRESQSVQELASAEIASFPTPFADGSGVLLFVTSAKGVSVRAIPLVQTGATFAWQQPAWGRSIVSFSASYESRAAQAELVRFAPYQAIASLQPSVFASPLAGAQPTDSLVIAHPSRGRLWRVSMNDGDGQLLPADAIAAASWQGGWFITRAKDLAYVDAPRETTWPVPARVIADSCVPRVLSASQTPAGEMPARLLVFGPSKANAEKLTLIELLPGG